MLLMLIAIITLEIPNLGGDVGLSVCLWEVSKLRSPQQFTNPSDLFPMFCPEPLLGFWSDQSETYIDSIYMGWRCVFFLGGPHRPFVCEWGRNLAPHNIIWGLHIDLCNFLLSFLLWIRLNKQSKSCQDHIKVT